MARNKQASFAKRKREQERQAKAAEKRARRRERAVDKKEEGATSFEDMMAPAMSKATDEEVQRAIERVMNPGKSVSRAGGDSRGGSASASTKLFIGNVDYDTDESELKALFVEAGFDVVSVNIARDRTTRQSRGFAFIELGTPSQAAQAIDRMSGAAIRNREIRVSPADRGR